MIDRHRLTSRVIVVDDEDRVLMFLTRGSVPEQVTRWITPGGGVDPGESHHDAACRELFEETGRIVDNLGDPVWSYDFEVGYAGGDHDTGHAEYYLLHTPTFTPSSENWTPEEHVDVVEHRWWALSEMSEAHDPYDPVDLPALLARLLSPS